MRKLKIITDSGCDLSLEIIEKLNIGYLGLVCNVNNQEIIEDCGQTLSYNTFYDLIQNGEFPVTGQITPFRFYNEFENYIKEGFDIIYIAFSSALSGTCNSSYIAKAELLESYPDAKITIIDSKTACSAQGLLVYQAAKLCEAGKNIDEVEQFINENHPKLNVFFYVKDLKHLEKGGRISPSAVKLGTMLNIKPLLTIDEAGSIQPVAKIRGEKKMFNEFVKMLEKHNLQTDNATIFVNHADDLESAKKLTSIIKEKYPTVDIQVNYVGLAIGSHTGKGALTMGFFAE